MKTTLVIILALILPFTPELQQEKKSARPLPQHFSQRLGTFRAEMEFYQPSGEIAFKTVGTQVNTLICGGLWLQEDLKADMQGEAFHGRGLDGYDTKSKECVGTWVDSMSSHLMVHKGKLDAGGRKLVATGQIEVEGGGLKPGRLETLLIDKNHYEFRMYIVGGAKELLTMKIRFTRK